jgi:hypothetical protein
VISAGLFSWSMFLTYAGREALAYNEQHKNEVGVQPGDGEGAFGVSGRALAAIDPTRRAVRAIPLVHTSLIDHYCCLLEGLSGSFGDFAGDSRALLRVGSTSNVTLSRFVMRLEVARSSVAQSHSGVNESQLLSRSRLREVAAQ